MAPDSRADDTAARSLRQAGEQLLSGLSRAIFGVCAVAVGLVALFVGAGSTGDSAMVFLLVGVASLLVGVVTISRLPKPDEAANTVTASASTTETPSSDDTTADSEAPVEEEPDRHRQQAD